MLNSKKWILISGALLVVAFCVSIYLTDHHFSLMYGMQDSKSFCNVSSKFDCDAVNVSRYSEIGGVPVALLAAFAFLVEFIFLLGVALLNEEETPAPSRILFGLSLGNVAASLVMAIISTFLIKVFCLFCVTLYAVSLLLLFSSWKIIKTKGLKFTWRQICLDSKSWVVGVLLAIIPFGSFLTHKMMLDGISSRLDEVVNDAVKSWQGGKAFDFHLDGEPRVGSTNPKLTLIVFSDFQCPHCKRAAPSIHAFVSAHSQEVQLVYQNFPLNSSCNSHVQTNLHPETCNFTKAAICSNKQGKYAQTHDWIFENQEGLSLSKMENLKKQVGLDGAALDSCMQSSEIDAEIQKQISRAIMANVEATPSIFANGKFLPHGYLIPVLEKVLNYVAPK